MTQLTELDGVRFFAYSLHDVFSTRDKIIAALSTTTLGATLDQGNFHDYVTVVSDALQVHRDIITSSSGHLYGRYLSKALAKEEAWRLAGNLHRLRALEHVPLWTGHVHDEWVPVQVVASSPYRTAKGSVGRIFDLRILAGYACTQLTSKFWSTRYCYYLSRLLGFDRSNKPLAMTQPQELVGMRCYVLLKANERAVDADKPHFEQLHIPASLRAYNRKLVKKRQRIGFACPKKFSHPCYNCYIGYDVCSVAVHPSTYKRVVCVRCGKLAWLDPRYVAAGVCVSCKEKESIAWKKP